MPPLAEEDGEAFFIARARAVDPSFTESEAVAELCLRLDELPLALELAAARSALFSPEQLLERLSERLDLLKGDRDADPRQQTLRATIEWSYDLLSEEEQELFASPLRLRRRLHATRPRNRSPAPSRTRSSRSSTRASFGRRETEHGPRYWMLETIREYAAGLLDQDDERQDFRERHLRFYLALVEEAEPNLTGSEQRRWYERVALEEDNIREALTYACDRGDGERALMLAGTIWRFWWTRGQIAEASRWYERAFAVAANASEIARARGLFGAAHMAEARGDVDQARSQFEESAGLFRRLGETRWLILALAHLSGAYGDSDPQHAKAILLEALELAEASGDLRGAAIAKGNLADKLLTEGDDERAAALLEEALEGHPCARRHLRGGNMLSPASRSSRAAAVTSTAAATNVRESLELSHSIRTYSPCCGRSRSPRPWCSRVVIRTLPPACARLTKSCGGFTASTWPI